MNVFDMLINDPVVLISFIGLAIVLGICGFYVYYFLKNIENSH
ncbi:hypothetical protein tinsulaeT_22680 [Thalassotalea insulae]|uniref:DUF3149 domain-containing protein n=1 Tax=Thalassotalea insulae TaxID=2056778 RepID=A0ABQ6GSN1_9GAMM|nr:DUF3149 domain-containing protein [Thalassotalea insulae]GLX78928.1 hypothetical protein tinsulaeT_22680 [Thalassotalea insulae]